MPHLSEASANQIAWLNALRLAKHPVAISLYSGVLLSHAVIVSFDMHVLEVLVNQRKDSWLVYKKNILSIKPEPRIKKIKVKAKKRELAKVDRPSIPEKRPLVIVKRKRLIPTEDIRKDSDVHTVTVAR